MNKIIAAVMAGCVTLAAAPGASAQTAAEQRRWDDAQRRFEDARSIYERERQIYDDARARGARYGSGGYREAPYRDDRYRGDQYRDDRFATDYDASRDYREDTRYRERVLNSEDQVYRGSDGRYYCRRSDGTTGLIIGGAAGGILGNVIDGGRQRTAGTLIGGALGALLGRGVEQNQEQVRCR